MIVIEVGDLRAEAETEKEAKKLLAKLLREKKKRDAEKQAEYERARMKAESVGYRALSRVASGDSFPCGWRFYANGKKWSEHLFRPTMDDGSRTTRHQLNTEGGGWLEIRHYGNDVIGAVCQGSGYIALVFLRDHSTGTVTCLAVGSEGESCALAECPGITPEIFHRDEEDSAAETPSAVA